MDPQIAEPFPLEREPIRRRGRGAGPPRGRRPIHAPRASEVRPEGCARPANGSGAGRPPRVHRGGDAPGSGGRVRGSLAAAARAPFAGSRAPWSWFTSGQSVPAAIPRAVGSPRIASKAASRWAGAGRWVNAPSLQIAKAPRILIRTSGAGTRVEVEGSFLMGHRSLGPWREIVGSAVASCGIVLPQDNPRAQPTVTTLRRSANGREHGRETHGTRGYSPAAGDAAPPSGGLPSEGGWMGTVTVRTRFGVHDSGSGRRAGDRVGRHGRARGRGGGLRSLGRGARIRR